MSFEIQTSSQGWGPENPSLQRSRFQEARDALTNPAMQEYAKKIGRDVGGSVVRGALENAGVVKYDDEGNMKVRKFGAVKAALRPTHTARKAAMGALSGTKDYAKEQAVGVARQKLSEAFVAPSAPTLGSPETTNSDWGYGATTESTPAQSTPSTESWSDWTTKPTPRSSAEATDWWSATPATPAATPAASGFEATGFNDVSSWSHAERTDTPTAAGFDSLVTPSQSVYNEEVNAWVQPNASPAQRSTQAQPKQAPAGW